MSLEPEQDAEKIRSYDGKTGRVHNGIHQDGKPSYWDFRNADGFTIKKVEDSHLQPIKPRNYFGKNSGKKVAKGKRR